MEPSSIQDQFSILNFTRSLSLTFVEGDKKFSNLIINAGSLIFYQERRRRTLSFVVVVDKGLGDILLSKILFSSCMLLQRTT